MLMVCMASPVTPETSNVTDHAAPGAREIVQRMQQHDAEQSRQLNHYQAMRHYEVSYAGLGTSIAAKMDVEVVFDRASGKNFRIVSQSGSKLLCDMVLKRAVDSELEASQDRMSNALTPENYQFELAGSGAVDGRPAYILQVKPWHANKFLYRGRIWVDAEDFALVKVEAEPAKNPSIWLSRTSIEYSNAKTEGMWLPAKNHSESRIRVGGTAVLSIDYGAYSVAVARPLTAEAF